MICKIHVILRHLTFHPKEERFIPVLAGTFWLTILLQSLLYIFSIRLNNASFFLFINEWEKAISIALFLFLTAFFYIAVKNEEAYEKAEEWFYNLEQSKRKRVLIFSAIFMVTTFLIAVLTMIGEISAQYLK